MELIDDLKMLEACSTSEIYNCIHIGLVCVHEDPTNRPPMSSVVGLLTSDSMTLPNPTNPGFFVRRVVVESNQSADQAHMFSTNEVTISDLEPR